MEKLIKDVLQWSVDKGICEKANLRTQWEKMSEEVEEVKEAIEIHAVNMSYKSAEELSLEIGDVMVTSIILAQLHGIQPQDCLQMAYDKISKRTGKMINGTFVKSEDL